MMNQTNYQLFDFMEVDSSFREEEYLWKACLPTAIEECGDGRVVVTIPFQRYLQSNDLSPDPEVPRTSHKLVLSAYGGKIIRFSSVFRELQLLDSEMLQMDPCLTLEPLSVIKLEGRWEVQDTYGHTRAMFDFSKPEIDYWSELLPPADETLKACFYPDGKKEIRINESDQFFPARCDAFALAYVEKAGIPDRATISFGVKPDEVFVGTGE